MKISKLFHWLYACIMFIPIFTIPAFMIYSHRHDVAQDFEVTEQEPVYYESNEVNSVSDLIYGNMYHLTLDDENYPNTYFVINFESYYSVTGNFIQTSAIGANPYTHVPYLRTSTNAYSDFILGIERGNDSDVGMLYRGSISLDFVLSNNENVYLNVLFPYISESSLQIVKEYTEVTTSIPKDIMTSFIDRLANVIDTYFNFNQYLGIGNLYNWFNINVFNGSAPLGFTIFWNLLIYWLLVSIAWLIFDIAMFVPKLAHRWIDKASLE